MASYNKDQRGRNRGRGGGRGGSYKGRPPRESSPNVSVVSRKRQGIVNENSPVIKSFRHYQTELDARHDRYERIIKLSRDITIESKRVIFLLQRCAGEAASEKETVLQQAEAKLKEIQISRWLSVALEMDGQDHYQYIRAYSPGLQEYVEAVSFWHYLKESKLVSQAEVEKGLLFTRPCLLASDRTGTLFNPSEDSTAMASPESASSTDIEKPQPEDGTSISEKSTLSKSDVDNGYSISVTIPPGEFMLGIADLTGELMRTAIMSVGEGDLDYLVKICDFLRVIHDAFTAYGNTAGRELGRKMAVLRQSLEKVENACYTLKVRGSEIPKHMLADIFISSAKDFFDDNDEMPVNDD